MHPAPSPLDEIDRLARFAAAGLVPPEAEAEAAQEREAQWNSSLKPCNVYELFLVRLIAVNSLRIERCHDHEARLRGLQSVRAGACWDEDRRLSAEELGARLAKAPAIIGRRLRGFKQGCAWLIGRWEGLRDALESGGDWTADQLRLALDLLGVPVELRDGPTPLDDREGRPHRIGAEVDRLRDLQAGALDDLDGRERELAILGLAADPGAELRALRNYERACSRRLEWAWGQLKKGRHEFLPGGTPAPNRRGSHTAPLPSPAPLAKSEADYREEARALAARRKAATISDVSPPEPAATAALAPIEPNPAPIRRFPTQALLDCLEGDRPAPGNRRTRRVRLARLRKVQ